MLHFHSRPFPDLCFSDLDLFHTSLPFCPSYTTLPNEADTDAALKATVFCFRDTFDGLPSPARGMPAFLDCILGCCQPGFSSQPSLILPRLISSPKHSLSSVTLVYSLSQCSSVCIIRPVRNDLLPWHVESHQSYFGVDSSYKDFCILRGFFSFMNLKY